MRLSNVAVGIVVVSTCWALGLYGSRHGLQYFSKREKTTKQSRREMMRSNRRGRKDERLKVKKQERSRALAVERENMTEEQKNEQRERIRMQRVEQFMGRHEEPLEHLYDSDKLVYLSPDSDNVLEQLDPAYAYVVGGIVDRSVRKGETKTKAATRGIRTARLPLQEHYEQLGTRVRTHIMNLDSVLIVLNEVANHGDWGRAFERAVPTRITRKKESKKKKDQNSAEEEAS
ncbi:tRNA methyltransferase 10 A [Phytophthora nicotianae]|uniref:tRNA (guanine(9)-N(1))-methyltransferase n=1 Tax=Phytophthora nicotianae TaxID=4792 RepID=A0A0W8BWX9_PHYNI|nr:tRNA methyltransferase 10 A [Phytophthora nicotianae]KUF93687.1 tRNA methyltransferase 10 A [Phytophthora nicotianae]